MQCLKQCFEDYERDGWQVGYEVQLNGVGIQRVVENPADNDSESGIQLNFY